MMLRAARLYAVSEYPDPDDWLPRPVEDARALRRMLLSARGGDWPDVDVVLRANSAATWASFRIDMWFLSLLGRLDYLLVTLHGHGVDGAFSFHDETIGYRDIAAELCRVDARVKVVVADACESGLARQVISGLGAPDPSGRMADALLAAGPGVRVLTATNRRSSVRDDASLVRGLLIGARRAVPDGPGGTVTLGGAFRRARGWMLERHGPDYPWPESRGDLDVPFAVSDAIAPFGTLAVVADVPWASGGGRRVHVPLRATVLGRRLLPTSVTVALGTTFGETEVTTHEFTPRESAHVEPLNVYLGAGHARIYGSRLLVRGFDGDGRQFGPTVVYRLDPVFDALPLAV